MSALPPQVPSSDTLPPTVGGAADPLDLVDESVIVFGLDMRVRIWNAAAERLYGWRREEMIGGIIQAAVRCVPAEPLAVIMAKVHEFGTWRGEFVRVTKSGGHVAVHTKWTLRRTADGDPLDIVETTRDVTDVRKAQEAYNRVRHQYESLFQGSAACFLEIDAAPALHTLNDLLQTGIGNMAAHLGTHRHVLQQMMRDTRILDVNEQTLKTFGAPGREALQNLQQLWPDDSLIAFGDCVVAALQGRPSFSAEVGLRTLAGGQLEAVLTAAFPTDVVAYPKILLGVVDVTAARRARRERERAEQQYRDLFHFMPIALMRLDGHETMQIYAQLRAAGVTDLEAYTADHPGILDAIMDGLRIAEVNQRAVSTLRAKSIDELTGSVARYWPLSRDTFCKACAARFSGKPAFEALTRLVGHDGTAIDVLYFAAFGPITGAPQVSIIGLIDVSDRVRAQEMLARVQAEMAHAARVSVLGELTASIAHEINQPLTAIQVNTEASLIWLEHSPPNLSEVKELAERTASEAQRAGDIIHRIRSMATHAPPRKETVALNTVVDEALLFLRHEIQRQQVRIRTELAASLPLTQADRVQLQQVVVNLAMNALQAMSSTDRDERELVLRTDARADGRLQLEVEDSGAGISEVARGRLFESFFTTKSSGMGMGLPICRSIVESHGGEILAENRLDSHGARFTVLLPVQ